MNHIKFYFLFFFIITANHATCQFEISNLITFQNIQEMDEDIFNEEVLCRKFPIVFIDTFTINTLKSFRIHPVDKEVKSALMKYKIFSLGLGHLFKNNKNEKALNLIEDSCNSDFFDIYILGKKRLHFFNKVNLYFIIVMDTNASSARFTDIYSLNFKDKELKSIVLLESISSDYPGSIEISSYIKSEAFESIEFKYKSSLYLDDVSESEKQINYGIININKDGMVTISN